MDEKQRSLFGAPERESGPIRRGLVPIAQPGQPLTKAQRLFKRLVAKVESLRAKQARDTQRLDKALAYYGEHLHPRVLRQAALRKDLVRAAVVFLDDQRLKKGDRKALRALLSEQLSEILDCDQGLADADLRAIFARIVGRNFADFQREEMERALSAMEQMAEHMGVDVDFSGMRADLSEAEMAAQAAELSARMRAQAEEGERQREERRSQRRKSPRQKEREETLRQVEETRAKSMASIYKQLARALHPDLEQDVELRQRKSLLMQDLTAAYRNNDLHTLLRLELEWIQREEGDVERLTDAKLGVYNQVLKEQADDLDREIFQLPGHPRYSAIVQGDLFFESNVRTDGPAQARELDLAIADMQQSLARLRSVDGIQEIRHLTAVWRQQAPF